MPIAVQAEQLLGMKADELAEIRESGACPGAAAATAAATAAEQLECIMILTARGLRAVPLGLHCRCEALPGCAQVGAVAGQRAAPQGTGAGAAA